MSSEDKKFWAALFDENRLALQLPTLADEQVEGAIYPSSHSGYVKVKVVRASALGDNFMSDTYLVTASAKCEHSRTGFIKILPSNAMMREAAWGAGVYVREIGVYRDLFPALREIRGDKPIALDVSESYYARSDDKDLACIILQDLKVKGFSVTDKTHGSDYQHALLLLTSLANYHALTIAAVREWIETDPTTGRKVVNYPENLKFFAEKSSFEADPVLMIKDWLNKYIQFTHELERPDLAEFLENVADRLPEVMKNDTLESCGPMACLMHGDYWNNNFMFRYNRHSKPVALMMVDFQLARLGHPLNDLLYFFYSSTLPELREKHLIRLFRHYFDTLCSKLDLLEVEVDFTWEEFLAEYKKRSLMWGLMGGMVMSFVLNKSVVETLNDLDEQEQNKSKSEPEGEVEKGFTGMSLEMETKMIDVFKTQKMSDNPLLTDRLLKLAVEIKTLNES